MMNLIDTMNDVIFVEKEVDRINADTVQGEQSTMVQSDMRDWALDNDIWASSDHKFVDYRDIVGAYAQTRGWCQEEVNGMEVVETRDCYEN